MRDGIMIADKQQFEGAFTHSFHIMNHTMTIMQHGEHFELRIDNVSFSHLHAQEQTKNQFVFDGDDSSQKGEVKYPSQISKGSNQPTSFDFNNNSGGGIKSTYDHPGGNPMQGFGNSPSSRQTKVTSYTVKQVQRRPVGRGSRTTTNINGSAAAARGWDDVAAARDQAFGGDDGDEKYGSDEKPNPTSFDFDNFGSKPGGPSYDSYGDSSKGKVSMKQAFKNSQYRHTYGPGAHYESANAPQNQSKAYNFNGFSSKSGTSGGWPSSAAGAGGGKF